MTLFFYLDYFLNVIRFHGTIYLLNFKEVNIVYLIVTILVLLLFGGYFFWQNYIHKVTSYTFSIPKKYSSLKNKEIVFISDTHFRKDLSYFFIDRVLSEIEQIDPDVILFGGDIVHETSYDQVIEHTKDFFSQLVKIAPTYVVYGNHDLESHRKKEITDTLKRVGVTLLDNKSDWITFDDPNIGFHLIGLNEEADSISMKQDALSQINWSQESKKGLNILLAHYPHFIEKYRRSEAKIPDLILSGDTHGGQVILPIIGGLYVPRQGFNPYYDFGIFTDDTYSFSRLIISRGLGNSSFPLRINNRPEIIKIRFN